MLTYSVTDFQELIFEMNANFRKIYIAKHFSKQVGQLLVQLFYSEVIELNFKNQNLLLLNH